MARLFVLGALFQFLWERKAWWLLPPVIALVVVAVLVIVAQSSVVGPFIYPLF